MRRYYLHKRSGVFYAELVTPEGRKLTARSTGKTTRDEALLVVSKWLLEGIPAKGDRLRPVEAIMGLDGILKAVRKTDLDGNDAMKIIAALKERGLSTFPLQRPEKGQRFSRNFWGNSGTMTAPRMYRKK